MRSSFFRAGLFVVALVSATLAVGQVTTAPTTRALAKAVADRASGVYGPGEPIRFRLTGGVAGEVVQVAPKRDGATAMEKREVTVGADGSAEVVLSLDAPASLLVEFSGPGVGGDTKDKVLAGAVVSPEKLAMSAESPSDFAAFWDGKLAEMNTVAPSAEVRRVPELDKPGIEFSRVRLDGYRGSKVYGNLARPAAAGKRPAMLVLQWAGVYQLKPEWVTGRASEGWLVLNISAHEIPPDAGEEQVRKLAEGELKSYLSTGNDDRETSYFLRMYLAGWQAARYLSERDDWDGRTLVVMGSSMGGQQALAVAGLSAKVTAVAAMVPSGCDVTASRIGRAAGYPYWSGIAKSQGKDPERVMEVGRYFDTGNFLRRSAVRTLIGVGLIDVTCPPAGVIAAANGHPDREKLVELVILPESAHQSAPGTDIAYRRAERALLERLRRSE
jgi:cephalosporin-C deacetylase